MHIDATELRRTGGVLASHGAEVGGERARLAADDGRPWGGDRLGAPFDAAYLGACGAALDLLGMLAAGVTRAGADLAAVAARTEQADGVSAAAFGRSA